VATRAASSVFFSLFNMPVSFLENGR
jgi:hypothetical protein